MPKFLKGYRTIIFSIATILVSLAELSNFVDVVSPQYTPIILLLVGIGNFLLRLVTTTPPPFLEKETEEK